MADDKTVAEHLADVTKALADLKVLHPELGLTLESLIGLVGKLRRIAETFEPGSARPTLRVVK